MLCVQAMSPWRDARVAADKIVEKIRDTLPFGIGIALGLAQLTLDWVDLKQEVDDLTQNLLCTAIDVLVALEVGLRKLPVGSQVAGRAGYRDEVTRAVVLCCAVRTRPAL